MPQDLRLLMQRNAETMQEHLRQLIVEGQAPEEVRAADPDQLVRAIFAYLDGLARGYVIYGPEKYVQQFPETDILLHMLRP